MARILVTGAGGFIGRALCRSLAGRGHFVIAGLRRAPPAAAAPVAGGETRILGDIAPGRDWAGELDAIDIVIHLAQRAHRRAAPEALAAEPAAAATLARAAARAGARRFVYLSSIIAMGDATPPGRPFRADDEPCPAGAYGRAKLATERALREIAGDSGLDLVILRPPLVYGPEVGGNFGALARLAASGLPLPFAGIDNRRSLIYRDNLADLAAAAALDPAAAGRTLLAADGTDFSTADLVRALAAGQGRRARLFALPDAVFAALRRLPALRRAVSSLTLSLEVDDRATRETLGWTPPVPPAAALAATARALASR